MNTRIDKYRKNTKHKNFIISILFIVLVLGLSFLIANKLSIVIYKSSLDKKPVSNIKNETVVNAMDTYSIPKVTEDNLILFQGGVFTDLESAENFQEKIKDKTISIIVNDGKYERLIVGLSNKKQYSNVSSFLKENNIQFVKQIYRFPENVKYNIEIMKIIDVFTQYILENKDNISEDKLFEVEKMKNQVSLISGEYGNTGSYKEFNDLKDMILELDDKAEQKDIESVLDFIYFSFKKYKI